MKYIKPLEAVTIKAIIVVIGWCQLRATVKPMSQSDGLSYVGNKMKLNIEYATEITIDNDDVIKIDQSTDTGDSAYVLLTASQFRKIIDFVDGELDGIEP